MIFVTFVQ